MVELAIVIVILGVLLTTAVASLLRARTASNESAAIANLRTISSAQFAYASACGSGNYATSLIVLGAKPPGNSQGYLSDDLGSAITPTRNGYTFNVGPGGGGAAAPNDCNGIATQTRYYASAVPAVLGTTGNRAFATNQVGAIWGVNGAAAPTEPFGAPATPAQ